MFWSIWKKIELGILTFHGNYNFFIFTKITSLCYKAITVNNIEWYIKRTVNLFLQRSSMTVKKPLKEVTNAKTMWRSPNQSVLTSIVFFTELTHL